MQPNKKKFHENKCLGSHAELERAAQKRIFR
jgi:hypothetical protein